MPARGLTEKPKLRQLDAGVILRRSGVNGEVKYHANCFNSGQPSAGRLPDRSKRCRQPCRARQGARRHRHHQYRFGASPEEGGGPALKPTWDQCYDMSVNRGFNHDSEEWHQAIVDCLDGKIPY